MNKQVSLHTPSPVLMCAAARRNALVCRLPPAGSLCRGRLWRHVSVPLFVGSAPAVILRKRRFWGCVSVPLFVVLSPAVSLRQSTAPSLGMCVSAPCSWSYPLLCPCASQQRGLWGCVSVPLFVVLSPAVILRKRGLWGCVSVPFCSWS